MKLEETEKLLGILAHETRMRLLITLAAIDKEVCVCELEDGLNLPQYSVSRHLNKLKEQGMVESRREGTWAYYSLTSDLKDGKREIIDWLVNYVSEETLEKDIKEMGERLGLREDGKCVAGSDEVSGCQ